ncbi:MAG: DUF4430 domain-containing protein [Oscillospiraceae bacterium]|nr:DUF4430 domain-containing protein [Oscillospiraceae bacterium]
MNRKMVRTAALALALLLALTLAFSGCGRDSSGQTEIGKEVYFTLTITDGVGDLLFDEVIHAAQGKTLADAMQSALGDGFVIKDGFVTELCGVAGSAEDKTYWALYVNGEYAQAGVMDYIMLDSKAKYQIEPDDKVDFILESYE